MCLHFAQCWHAMMQTTYLLRGRWRDFRCNADHLEHTATPGYLAAASHAGAETKKAQLVGAFLVPATWRGRRGMCYGA